MKGLPDFASLLENEFDKVHSNGIPKRHWFQMQAKMKENNSRYGDQLNYDLYLWLLQESIQIEFGRSKSIGIVCGNRPMEISYRRDHHCKHVHGLWDDLKTRPDLKC